MLIYCVDGYSSLNYCVAWRLRDKRVERSRYRLVPGPDTLRSLILITYVMKVANS